MCSTFGVRAELRTIARARFQGFSRNFSFHFEETFGSVSGIKCATHLEHDCATCEAGLKWLKNWGSLQFASWKRYRSGQERGRFEEF